MTHTANAIQNQKTASCRPRTDMEGNTKSQVTSGRTQASGSEGAQEGSQADFEQAVLSFAHE